MARATLTTGLLSLVLACSPTPSATVQGPARLSPSSDAEPASAVSAGAGRVGVSLDTPPAGVAAGAGSGNVSAEAASSTPTASAPLACESEAPAAVRPFEGGKHAVSGDHGLVVAVEAQAAHVGAQVLEKGGNAVDAAIATLFALAVTHPSAASLGGGGFVLVRRATGPIIALDFVPTAPAALTREAFDRMIAAGGIGPRSVGVPGLVAGLAALHERFASRPWAELLAPAIRLAQGQVLGRWPSALVEASRKDLAKDRAARRIFLEKDHARAPGTRFSQLDLAWTLTRLAEHGANDFYRGAISERLVRALAADGFQASDFATYRAVEREPLRLSYGDVELVTMAPPSAGGVALLGTLLGARQAASTAPPGSAADVHVLLEAERRAQAERRFSVTDPDVLSASELAMRRAQWTTNSFWSRFPIDPEHVTPSETLRAPSPALVAESEHTTHVSVVDHDGMVVSFTTTLCASFGARVVAAGTGIVLNNAVATFASSGENQPAPSRRTTSSMSPTLLLNGERTLAVLGTPGGDTIPSTLAQIVRHLVDERLPLDRAIEAPRWHHGFLPDRARYEPALGRDVALLKALTVKGHQLRPFPHRIGDANCIVMDGERAYGYADSREPGVAIAARAKP